MSGTHGKFPQLVTPPDTCDTHMHFYNDRFAPAPTALMTPPNAWVEDYRAIQQRLGLKRVVVVQPTTYGTDNSCQLEAMKAFGDEARGGSWWLIPPSAMKNWSVSPDSEFGASVFICCPVVHWAGMYSKSWPPGWITSAGMCSCR